MNANYNISYTCQFQYRILSGWKQQIPWFKIHMSNVVYMQKMKSKSWKKQNKLKTVYTLGII